MKKLFTLLALITTMAIFAQAPQGFNYQATVRNSAGALITNQIVGFKFSIKQTSASGTTVYSETQYVTPDNLGQVSLVVGTGLPSTTATFAAINWASGTYYLAIELNTGSGFLAMGTTQLLSVPYAFYANSAGNINFPNGTNAGDILNWTWNGTSWIPKSSIPTAQLPLITTITATNTLTPSPSSGGTITSDGGYSITSKGVCWSVNPNPTNNDNSTNNGNGASNFTSVLIDLLPTTTYYYRAYATNSIGTGYGITYTFTTVAVPNLTTTTTLGITTSTAISGGTISIDGGASITAKGVCWSTSTMPTIDLATKTNNGAGTATFTSSLSGLAPVTTYYVRAYATNSFGTGYGQEQVFKTLVALPTLTTTATTAITIAAASSGGTISSDGGASITAKGVCWSTSTMPIIDLATKTNDGTGAATFTSSLSGLAPGTTYYVRAYATNIGGTAYGAEVSFTTTVATITNGTQFWQNTT